MGLNVPRSRCGVVSHDFHKRVSVHRSVICSVFLVACTQLRTAARSISPLFKLYTEKQYKLKYYPNPPELDWRCRVYRLLF